MKKLIYISFLFITFASKGQVFQVSGSGTWSPTVSTTAITEAGRDYGNSYALESLSNQTLINLQRSGSFFQVYLSSWRVDISRSDVNWNNNLQLEVRRTGNGTGTGWWIFAPNIANGTNYQPVSTASSQFFTGNGIYRNIPIQYRIRGLSVLIPADTYSTNVVYTFLEL